MLTRTILVIAAVAVVALAVAFLFVLRSPITVASTADPDVVIECGGATGVTSAACTAWGDAILADGAPTTTFELEDVVRIRIDRPTFGLSSTCAVAWFLGRYPDEVAWEEEVPCAERSPS